MFSIGATESTLVKTHPSASLMASFEIQAELESEKLTVHTPKSQIDPHTRHTHKGIEIHVTLHLPTPTPIPPQLHKWTHMSSL